MKAHRGAFRGYLRCGVAALAIVVGLIVLQPSVGMAQTATVTGRVTDPSGAVVPGAMVTATNASSGLTKDASTNSSGVYTLPFIQPGEYNFSVEKQGFKRVIRSNVKLDVNQTAGINFELQVGQTVQTVNVTSSVPLLQTQTASVGQQIANKTIVTLPLNGRDYTQLVTLGAGATPNPQSRANNGFSLNGGRTLQTQIMLNGTDNTNYGIGTDTHNVNVLQPSIDAIQEFKVETANYSAEYGRSAGGVVSVVLKSGTNQFHGDAFEFLRNNALDANNFFANRDNLPSPTLRRNQFGGVLGGPIIKNRLFFFASYQGTRQTSQSTGSVTVPTPEEVNGNFGSIAIYNPFDVVNGVRQQFSGNIIPTGLMDPVGMKLAALYPTPNLPGLTNNYGYNQNTTTNADEFDARFDGQISQKDSAFFSYDRGTEEDDFGSIFAPPGNGLTGTTAAPYNLPIDSYLITIGETHTFSSTMVNSLTASYTHELSNQLATATQSLYDQFGIKGVPQISGLTGLPYVGLTGFIGLGDRLFAPNLKLVQESQLNDVVSWVKGSHSITFGGEFIDTHNLADSWRLPRGQFNFSGQFTSQVPGKGHGSAIADLLLGQTSNAQLGTVQFMPMRNHYYGFFINDSWKASRRLTLNFGVRYEIQTPWWERNNNQSNFDYNSQSPTFGTLVLAKSGGYLARTFSNLDTNNIGPRVGLAYQLTPKTVIRSGFGVFYGNWGYMGNNETGTVNPPFDFNVATPSATSALLSDSVLANGFPSGYLNPDSVVNPALYAVSANYPMPVVDQWNASVQRELPGDSTLTVAYVGSSGSHLASLNYINAPPPGPGSINPRRPFPQFGEIQYRSPYAHATYHSLQVTFERNFKSGFSVLSAYTWSKSLDNVRDLEDSVGGADPQNPNNLAAEKAPSGFDTPNRFVTSVVYHLPFANGNGMIGGSRIGRTVLGGWELGGIFTAQSGFYETPAVSPNPANTTTPARPDRLCNGNLSSGQRSIDQWYNPGCFAPAAPYTYGNSSRQVIEGPGFVNLDSIVDRTFSFTESKSLEFRAEFFNFTNTAHFNGPNMTVNQPGAGTINSAKAARIIQFGLKFKF